MDYFNLLGKQISITLFTVIKTRSGEARSGMTLLLVFTFISSIYDPPTKVGGQSPTTDVGGS